MNEDLKTEALIIWEKGYRLQLQGKHDEAISFYQESISIFPTSEAFTFLGWAFSFKLKYDIAISYCKQAIEIDPDFGNPYNDIGAYLIQLKKYDEAIPWLNKAIEAKRYDAYHFAYLNLGHVYEELGKWIEAVNYYSTAIEIDPAYEAAITAKRNLLAKMN